MRKVKTENVVRTVERSDGKSVMLELRYLCSEWLLRGETGGLRGLEGMGGMVMGGGMKAIK